MENITFWTPPFKQGYEYSWYVYDNDNNFCFQIDVETLSIERDKEIYQKIIRILNGETNEKIIAKLTIVDWYKILLNDNIPFITIRGWGMLTWFWGYNLDAETASQIQDDFALWIVNKLKK